MERTETHANRGWSRSCISDGKFETGCKFILILGYGSETLSSCLFCPFLSVSALI